MCTNQNESSNQIGSLCLLTLFDWMVYDVACGTDQTNQHCSLINVFKWNICYYFSGEVHYNQVSLSIYNRKCMHGSLGFIVNNHLAPKVEPKVIDHYNQVSLSIYHSSYAL